MSNSSRSGIMPWPRSRKPCSPSLAGDELMSGRIYKALERFDLEAKNLATPGQPVRHAVVTHALGTIRYPCLRVGHLKFWSGRRDSNPRPRPWQGRALPLSYTRIREIIGDRSPTTGRAMPNAAPECNSPGEVRLGRNNRRKSRDI